MLEIFECLFYFGMNILPVLALLFLLKYFIDIPKFIYRKLLHLLMVCSTILVIVKVNSIYFSLTCALIMLLIYPIVTILEKISFFSELLAEKRKGEIKSSLVKYFGMVSYLTLFGFIFKRIDLSICALLIWGVGDAIAALIGIPFGKHKIFNKDKSIEGSIAMFVISIICSYYIFGNNVSYILLGSLVATIVEVLSNSDFDNITVPTFIFIVYILLSL